jgi:hypothetical protein
MRLGPPPSISVRNTALSTLLEDGPLAPRDIAETISAADKLLEATENLRHRAILENYRRHAIPDEDKPLHRIEQIERADFISLGDARERLLPLLRSLPQIASTATP